MSADPAKSGETSASPIRAVNRISTRLFVVLTTTVVIAAIGLIFVSVQLANMRADIARLKDQALPRLIKLSQLSQESSASIAIAPAMSTNPTRFEFETLLSRIKDKTRSQDELIADISALIVDADAVQTLQSNSKLLAENQQNLTNVVRRQIDVRKRLEKHVDSLRRMARELGAQAGEPVAASDGRSAATAATVHRTLGLLLDPNRARFSRNKKEVLAAVEALTPVPAASAIGVSGSAGQEDDPAAQFLAYWADQGENMFRDKSIQLVNEFRIKALVEENSLIANRLLSSASNEFARASAELSTQIQQTAAVTYANLAVIAIVVIAFAGGSLLMWLILDRRVLRRLDMIRAALAAYSKDRSRQVADATPDEIGEISTALGAYMDEIDSQEAELAKQTAALEQLSSKLSKYLSPQVYDTIFAGTQEVRVESSRKKLTVFFSDIADFTETADRMESEELTQLLNQYLTEMSRIALDHGATIDKYVGDAILIFFGDPTTKGVKEDALACVKMAIAMRDRLKELEGIWRRSGIEKPLSCRIGIHTGFCTVGNFGSESRMDYTIIGGAVNMASRLESAAEPGQILISYETFAHVRDEIHCEEHGEIEVRGIAYPVAAYLAVDTHEAFGHSYRRFHENSPGLTIDIDIGSLTVTEKEHAADSLRRALDRIENGSAGPHKASPER